MDIANNENDGTIVLRLRFIIYLLFDKIKLLSALTAKLIIYDNEPLKIK